MSLCEYQNFKLKCDRADEELKDENYILALVLFSEIVVQSPGNINYIEKRSDCLRKLHEYKLAIRDLENAIKIESRHKILYEKAAECYLSIGNVAAAGKTIARFAKMFSDQKMPEEIILSCKRLESLQQKIYDSFKKRRLRQLFRICE